MNASFQIVFSVGIISMQRVYNGHTFTSGEREGHSNVLSLLSKHFLGNA